MKTKNETVKDYIKEHIATGFYQPGQMIESEYELVASLNVSRVTVRKALDDLVNERILNKQHGRGTFVNTTPQFNEFRNGIGFTREAEMRDLQVTSHNKSLRKVEASAAVAQDLRISIGTPVWEVIRTRYADNNPVAHEHVYYPVNLIGHLHPEDLDQSLYQLLASRGIHFAHADQRLDAINATAEIATHLKIPMGLAVIKMHVIAYMANGTPFNTGISHYQTQEFKLVQTVYGN